MLQFELEKEQKGKGIEEMDTSYTLRRRRKAVYEGITILGQRTTGVIPQGRSPGPNDVGFELVRRWILRALHCAFTDMKSWLCRFLMWNKSLSRETFRTGSELNGAAARPRLYLDTDKDDDDNNDSVVG